MMKNAGKNLKRLLDVCFLRLFEVIGALVVASIKMKSVFLFAFFTTGLS